MDLRKAIGVPQGAVGGALGRGVDRFAPDGGVEVAVLLGGVHKLGVVIIDVLRVDSNANSSQKYGGVKSK